MDVFQVGYGPKVDISISTNGGVEWSTRIPYGNTSVEGAGNTVSEQVLFEYHPPFLLGSVDPVSGPAIGGTIVTISLAPIASSNGTTSISDGVGNASEVLAEWQFFFEPIGDTSVSCLFNGTIVPATPVSNSSLECIAPPTVPGGGVSYLRVSVNGMEVFDPKTFAAIPATNISYGSSDALQFFYLPDEEEMNIFPASGPVKGGTLVEISSRHIANAAAAMFLAAHAIEENSNGGDNATNGQYYPLHLLPSSIKCSFGNSAAVAASELSFHWDGVVDSDGRETGVGRVLCVSPPAADDLPASVAIHVSLNGGRDFTQHGAQFHYRPEAHVSSVEPAYGPVTGGNPVRVEGGPFTNDGVGGVSSEQIVRCRFGDQETEATVHTAGLVGCRAPPMSLVPEQQDLEASAFSMYLIYALGMAAAE